MTRNSDENEGDPTSPLPVDLDLHVERCYRNGELFLRFYFSSPSRNAHKLFIEELRSPALRQLERFEEKLYQQLGQLHKSTNTDGEPLLDGDVERDLASLGSLLYKRLFPPEMGQTGGIYERFRDVESVRILSEEPWIPWEMVKAGDDDCFALRFRLGQWPATIGAVTSVHVERLAILEDSESGLVAADTEAAWLHQWATEIGIQVDRLRCETLEELEEFLLADRRQIYHIVSRSVRRPAAGRLEITAHPACFPDPVSYRKSGSALQARSTFHLCQRL